MSRTPANYSMTWVRGATVEDSFEYTDSAGDPIDLTGYEARMQVRTVAGKYGLTTASTLLLEADTTDADPILVIDIPPGGTVANRVTITIPPDGHTALNPSNVKRIKYAFALEVYQDGPPEYVIPLVAGSITVLGETTR
jgi:hypothetical protein